MRNQPQNDEWKARERQRLFVTREYPLVPWRSEMWHLQSAHFDNHFVHVSTHDPRMIAYTENADKGRRDIQTRVKPGKYLKRYFGDILSDDEIREWAEKFNAENVTLSLKFASEPDEIERVYVNGPDSCMSHDADSYEGSCHPTRVYGAGDLAIAYIEPEEGKITARAVCWPRKQIYARVYGDAPRLESLLERAGFRTGTSGEFEGAKLLRIESGDAFVCPYLDMGDAVDDRGSHLVIASCGDHGARETSGLTEDGRCCCERCGDRMREDDTYRVGDDAWCERCYSNHAFTCEQCEESYHNDYSRTVHNRRGHEITICDGCYDCGDYTSCDECGDDHHYDNLSGVRDGSGDETHVCETCRDENYSECEECCEHHHNDNVENVGDRCLCTDCAEEARAEEPEEPEAGPIDDPRQLPIPLEDAA